jgi:hypothetical protein
MENRYDDPAYAAVREQLTEAWWQYKDCIGAECTTPMAAELQQTVQQTTRDTRRYWTGINGLYGR